MSKDTIEERPASRYSVPALEKGLEILELMARSPTPLNLTTISAELGRSTGEIYRILQYLDWAEYIVRIRDSDTYALSMKLFTLSHEHPPVRSISAAAIPIMEDLVSRAAQSCHLGVLNRTNVSIVAQIDSPLPITYGVRLGAQFPVWETSSGVLLCAFQSDAGRRTLFGHLAQLIDEQALADLQKKMAEVIERGFEERQSIRIAGIINFSFPVFDRHGHIVAALTVPYLPQRSNPTTPDEVRELLAKAAAALSKALGFLEQNDFK